MPIAGDGGYFDECDPGSVDKYSLDCSSQVPPGDTIVITLGPQYPVATLTVDPGMGSDPSSQSWINGGPAFNLAPDGRPNVITYSIGAVAPNGFKAGVTYRFAIAFWTAAGLFRTNWAFIPCTPPTLPVP